jgi:putative ABC transport system permease protein
MMLSPRWRKVLRDLWGNKARTVLVILSIAVGVFAVGMIVSTQIILSNDLSTSYAATDPASAELYPAAFDEELVQVVRRMDGVREAEGRRSVSVRLKVGPDEWRTLNLDAIHDYNDMRIHKLAPVSGAWPPPKRELLIERASLSLTNAKVGDTIVIETPDGKQRQMRIAGLAHDMNKEPASFSGRAYGYVTFDTLEWLGFPRDFDELYIRVAENEGDKEHIQSVADQVQDKIEKSGRTVYWIWIPEPGEHPANESVEPMMIILGVLGTLSLFLSGFLVINTISALMAQQIRQIGIMKAVGARVIQIVQLYVGMVLIFSLLSLVVAVPLGGLAAYAFTSYLAGLINFDLAGFRIPPRALALEVAVGLIVPLLAALYPIFSGARITVREALSTYGLGKGLFGRSLIDRLLIGDFKFQISDRLMGSKPQTRPRAGRQNPQSAIRNLQLISRPMRLSLRNTFRRKGRLALTLSTLTLGGAIFIAVLSVHASLLTTFDDALTYWNYDIEVNFAHSHRIPKIEREAMSVPGVADAESWTGDTARRVRPDGHEGPNIYVLAPRADTNLIQPEILEGRWLQPDDENAIVLNTYALEEEPDIKVGDEIVLKIETRETKWRVVGIVKGVMTGRIAYANQPYFARVIRFVGRSGSVQIVGERHDPAFQSELEKKVKEHFDSRGLRVSSTETIASIRENVEYQFNIIVVFLSIMAILIAIVGGLGLMGTMSINVIERTREIGVMRAVGASDGSVLKVFMVEGLFIGVLSWLVGAILALPIGKLLSDAVGTAFTDFPLNYTFSTKGALLWLAVVLILAALASFLPSRSASRLTVREVLAYE